MTPDRSTGPGDAFAVAILAALDNPEVARASAAKLAAHLPSHGAPPDRVLDIKGAAEYLGRSVHALHKLTAARAVPCRQDGPNCKLWFLASELDAWLRAER